MRPLRLFGSFLILIVGCGRDTERTIDSSAGTTLPPPATAPALSVPPQFTNLTCEPATIRPGDVLTLRMTLPHGPTMMAIAPDSTQYLVVFHGEGSAGRAKKKTFVQPDAFTRATELSLDPRLVTAAPHVFGRDTNETLFRVPGVYRLVVGSDLETDGPAYAECLVRYER